MRGVWYRTDQFKAAGITSTPTTWAELVTDAQKLMKKFPGTYGIDAITDDTNAFASFIWVPAARSPPRATAPGPRT